MRPVLRCCLVLLVLRCLLLPARAADYPPQDHQGADLALAGGDRIWGAQVNIGTLTIPRIQSVTVLPYSALTPASGTVLISAKRIIIAGILDARGAGYEGGGGGGGGGGSAVQADGVFPPVAGNAGVAGQAARGGANGQDGHLGGRGFYSNKGGDGGAGGKADGSFAGYGGSAGIGTYPITQTLAGISGNDGGYLGTQMNGDYTSDPSVAIGSGGGGGGGGAGAPTTSDHIDQGGGGGAGGAAGGAGGGAISLHASEQLTISGTVFSAGETGQNGGNGSGGYGSLLGSVGGDGGDGGSPTIFSSGLSGQPGGGTLWAGGSGGTGGRGAGGGILLQCDLPGAMVLDGGTIDASGGGQNSVNGGTIKIFYNAPDPTANATLLYGRKYFSGSPDVNPPTYLGAAGAIAAVGVPGHPELVDLTWHQATDNTTPQNLIGYDIYTSLDPATVFSGRAVAGYLGQTEIILNFLPTGGRVSYFGVRARDLLGNEEMNTVVVKGPALSAVKNQAWMGYR